LKKVLVLVAVVAAFGLAATAASAGAQGPGPNGEHKVVVCKYVGTPGVDERLQTGNNPIVVDYHSLPGFDPASNGFPYAFADAQGQSIAVMWTFDMHFSDLSVCPQGNGTTGGTDTGGTDTGGSDSGGTDSGGSDTGGTDSGGTETGGTDSGGSDTGGTDSGGTDTGGTDTTTGGSGAVSGSTTSGTTGGTTGGTAETPSGGDLPFTGLPAWIPLLAAGVLLGSGFLMARRRPGDVA
jgi:hypothetical protein